MLAVIDSSDYLDIFKNYDSYFSNFNIIFDLLRSLGWLILKGLVKLANQVSKILDVIFDFLNFLNSDKLNDLSSALQPFIYTILLFGLIYLSYCYLFAHEKPKGVITNFLIFAGVMLILPYFMIKMNDYVSYGKEILSVNQTDSDYEMLDPYITDLLYLDLIDFDEAQIAQGITNGYDAGNYDNIKYLDINDIMDPSDYDLNNEDLFKQKISSTIKDGKDNIEVSKIKKSKFFFKDTTPYYYRYHVNFIIAMLYVLSIIIVLLFSSFKLIQLIYELTAEKIIAPFIAAGDLSNGQKIRKTLIGILNGYITILCILFLQKLFMIATAYINARQWSDNTALNGLAKVMMILAGALFIIDGPNFFEQIFGIDAGLKSVGQALQSAYYSSQMLGGAKNAIDGMTGKLGNIVKSPVNAAKNVAGASKKAMGMASKAAGVLNGMKDTGIFDSNNEKIQREMSGGSSVAETGKEKINETNDKEAGNPLRNPLPDGKGNLKSDLNGANQSVNQSINEAMNQPNATNGNNQGKDDLVSWAKNNTNVGQYLSDNYERGEKFGHAAGVSVNNMNNKPEQANKDNLKG